MHICLFLLFLVLFLYIYENCICLFFRWVRVITRLKWQGLIMVYSFFSEILKIDIAYLTHKAELWWVVLKCFVGSYSDLCFAYVTAVLHAMLWWTGNIFTSQWSKADLEWSISRDALRPLLKLFQIQFLLQYCIGGSRYTICNTNRIWNISYTLWCVKADLH